MLLSESQRQRVFAWCVDFVAHIVHTLRRLGHFACKRPTRLILFAYRKDELLAVLLQRYSHRKLRERLDPECGLGRGKGSVQTLASRHARGHMHIGLVHVHCKRTACKRLSVQLDIQRILADPSRSIRASVRAIQEIIHGAQRSFRLPRHRERDASSPRRNTIAKPVERHNREDGIIALLGSLEPSTARLALGSASLAENDFQGKGREGNVLLP